MAPDVKTLDDDQIVQISHALTTKYSKFPIDELPKVMPERIVPDKENRDRVGITVKGAEKQASTINRAGFVTKKTRIIATEFADEADRLETMDAYERWRVKQPLAHLVGKGQSGGMR